MAKKKTPSRTPRKAPAKKSPWPKPKPQPKPKPKAKLQPNQESSRRYAQKPTSERGPLVLRNVKAVEEYLAHKPEALLGIEATPALAQRLAKRCEQLGSAFNVAKIRTHTDWEADADGQSDSISAPIKLELGNERDLDDHLASGAKTVLVLDHIKDPRNFGAIARSCGFFGVDAIVIPNKRQVGVTQIVVDTAMGAFAKLTVFQVANLTRVLKTLKEAQFWVVGTALAGQPLGPKSLTFAKTALVIGAEDSGISPLIEKNCDLCLRIDGAADGIDSLNVSVATGIFLQALKAGQADGAGS